MNTQSPDFYDKIVKIKKFSDFRTFDDGDVEELLNFFELDGFGSKDDARYYLEDRLTTLERISSPEVVLYRIIGINKHKEIDREKLGRHWVLDNELFDDYSFIDSIGLNNSHFDKHYIITVSVPQTSIDIMNTLKANLSWPEEEEIYLKSYEGINVLSVEEFQV